jgi:hypothetical protein
VSCKDCPTDSKRPTPHPGPRCVTHHRAVRKARRLAAQEKRVQKVYGIHPDEYDRIYKLQGGVCYICRRATGARRRLSVDHDHAQAALDGHPLEQGCPTCVRGLLCSTCNKNLGHYRDDPAAFIRGAEYLLEWPSKRPSKESQWVRISAGCLRALVRAPRSAATAAEPATARAAAAA